MQKYSEADCQSVHRRWPHTVFFSLVVGALWICSAFGCGAEKSTVDTNDPTQLLRQMSDTLAQARKFSFKVERTLDAALVEGRNIPEKAQIEISVSRPSKFLAKSDSSDNGRLFVFDGQNLSVYDERMKLYATVAASGSIDDVLAKIDEKYGFTPPLAEFILSDPYGALSPRIKSQAYKGKETVEGIECHHLSFGGEVADSELWIGVADLLPHKLLATFKNREGGPQLQAEFSDWNLSATLDDNLFTFVAPQGAEAVEMVTEAQMKETAARAPRRNK